MGGTSVVAEGPLLSRGRRLFLGNVRLLAYNLLALLVDPMAPGLIVEKSP